MAIDFGNGFQRDILALDCLRHGRFGGHGLSDDEIDLPDSRERQLEKFAAVAAIVGRRDLELEIVQPGIEKRQELCIGEEDVDVLAVAMIELQHHRGAAAERP
ncbi:hypothetical protein JQ598_04460 [Bradyrhizobium sp. U87765 SZCCT0134]|uniref:hypothetical protein n=1 Tax=unclassified Bradyrhizobium TaxID=2631580 RepID=UPI001BA56043|nr:MULTISPECIES: hypothetical protein [unclassified Bradyrhizobium]MBR1259835.1 hypothetical protein [Bradyrhizobium sp. U87765 SZCCT0134]MBR1352374.1 hypothetical protein [Bradyrhizobium sp. U87765 SZCCT0048]